MGITIPSKVADYRGQCIESVKVNEDTIHIHCRRDKRFGFRGGDSGWRGFLNRWLRRVVEDIPLLGMRTLVHIDSGLWLSPCGRPEVRPNGLWPFCEYAQVFINRGKDEEELTDDEASVRPGRTGIHWRG